MYLFKPASLSLLTLLLTLTPSAISQGFPGQSGKPDTPLCNIFTNFLTQKCTLGINMWYNIPDAPDTQPVSTGQYGGQSVNEVKFYGPLCRELATLENFSPPDEDVLGTLTPPAPYLPLTIKGTSDGVDINPFQMNSNVPLYSSYLPTFEFTYDEKTRKQSNNFKTDGSCGDSELCSCTGKTCKRKEGDKEYTGWCISCPFDCKKPPASRIVRA
ncbi:MAG: hypothetical protein Q9160_002333 [Pyrenula sp. 1 TL-2023]